MSESVIDVQCLGKRYLIGHRHPGASGLRHVIEESIRHPLSSLRRLEEQTRKQKEEFWALREVSFSVKQGEAVGVVGRNGAGKSTLLKLLSRITEPTTGHIQYSGRVSSLLEVGTGFHPELTGRENIFLNAAILGMKRADITRQFDNIVGFAEVEKFLDTPVKRYSSGMYVRLAFAVAAHLEPEILLIDEVLAVGDAAFQKKCLGKIGDVVQEGRTVLFVSHNMAAIAALCTRSLLLEDGRLAFSGSPQEAIEKYLSKAGSVAGTPLSTRKDRNGNGRVRFTDVVVMNSRNESVEIATSGQDISISLGYELAGADVLNNAVVQIKFSGALGQSLFACRSRVSRLEPLTLVQGARLCCHIPKLPLMPGVYTFTIGCVVGETLEDLVLDAGKLTVAEGDYFGTGKLPPSDLGDFLVAHNWSVE